jgi:hypothetical protein
MFTGAWILPFSVLARFEIVCLATIVSFVLQVRQLPTFSLSTAPLAEYIGDL